jgi:hypothetical protein
LPVKLLPLASGGKARKTQLFQLLKFKKMNVPIHTIHCQIKTSVKKESKKTPKASGENAERTPNIRRTYAEYTPDRPL